MRARARSPLTLLAPLTLAATALLTAGCSSGSGTAQASAIACKSPGPATLPHVAGSLTEADSGAYCLGVGQTLDVFLTVPPDAKPGTKWQQIKVADTSVAGYGNSGVLTPPLGVTPGVFVGAKQGTTTLTSVLLPKGITWKVTLVVQ